MNASQHLQVLRRAGLVERTRRGRFAAYRLSDERVAAVLAELRALSGALSLPLAELKARLHELPKGRTVVAYCRGPFCLFARDAVRLLRRRGFDARRLEEGVAEWRARGLPLESLPPAAEAL